LTAKGTTPTRSEVGQVRIREITVTLCHQQWLHWLRGTVALQRAKPEAALNIVGRREGGGVSDREWFWTTTLAATSCHRNGEAFTRSRTHPSYQFNSWHCVVVAVVVVIVTFTVTI